MMELSYDPVVWKEIDHPQAVHSVLEFINHCDRDLRALSILAKAGCPETGLVYEIIVSEDHQHLYIVLEDAWSIHEVSVAMEGGLDVVEIFPMGQGRDACMAYLTAVLNGTKGFTLTL